MGESKGFTGLLVEKGVLAPEDGERLLGKFKGDEWSVLQYLLRGGAVEAGGARSLSGFHRPGGGEVSVRELARFWGTAHGVAHVDLEKTLFQQAALQFIPVEFARQYGVIPLYQLGDAVTVAVSDLTDEDLHRKIRERAGLPVSMVFALPDQIADAIEIQYQSADALAESISLLADNPLFRGDGQVTAEQLKSISQNERIVDLVRGLLLLSIRDRASDIHVEPEEERVRVRFRVDGVLQDRMDIEKPLQPPVMSYLKILADLDITERRRPQDGRIRLELTRRSIDFRFASAPTIHGEKAVLRVLGQMEAQEVPDLTELNFTGPALIKLRRAARNPNGIFLVTGPTGSGKSTTLFSLLKWLNKPDVNIMTIEDPVEYRLKGINQFQVHADVGFTFARALRAFLRMDPDIVLVGEIRDLETAKIAAEAALTGHLVVATMHTNSALQVVTRLTEMGVEPYLLSPALVGALSQRLVRRICDKCKEAYAPPEDALARYFVWEGQPWQGQYPVKFFRGKGCPECGRTGYRGRTAIQEIFLMTPNLRSLVAAGAPIGEIEAEAARAGGYVTLRHDGIKKVLRGQTTIEELERVTAIAEAD